MDLYNLNHGFLKWISDPTKGLEIQQDEHNQQKIIDSLTSIGRNKPCLFLDVTCNCKVCDIENVIGWMYKDPQKVNKVCYEKPTTKEKNNQPLHSNKQVKYIGVTPNAMVNELPV